MNLAAYDEIKEVNYKKTWINPLYKRLYSRELPSYKFYSFLKRYNPNNNDTSYYILLHNDIDTDLTLYPVINDKGITKIYLRKIWHEDIFKDIKNVINVDLIIEEKQDDCIVYKIDL